MLEGISDVKIVADDGEIRYLLVSVANNASLKPICPISVIGRKGKGD